MSDHEDPHKATYTHGHAESVLRSHRWRTVDNSASYLSDQLTPGRTLLDIGSGPGTITADFATRLSPGRVTALEATEAALELTRAEIEARGLANVDFLVGDVHALDIADGTFDIVHAHQVLQHVADPVLALREMRRVCKPDGVVAARDGDYAAFAWYPELPELDEWLVLYEHAARANGGEPDAGRRLHVWAREAGFAEVSTTSSTWCYANPDDRAWWGGMWADRILTSDLTRQLLDDELATRADLERISTAWRNWAADQDGWLSILHGEIICRG